MVKTGKLQGYATSDEMRSIRIAMTLKGTSQSDFVRSATVKEAKSIEVEYSKNNAPQRKKDAFRAAEELVDKPE